MKELIYNNEKENTILSVNYQFTHEYKKVEFNDEMNNELFGDVEFINDEQTVSDLNRFIFRKTHLYFIKSKKIGRLKIRTLTNWKITLKI